MGHYLYDIIPTWHWTDDNIILNKNRRKLTVVFDIDESLVHTSSNMEQFEKLNIFTDANNLALRRRTYRETIYDPSLEGGVADIWGVTRPYAYDLLHYCLTNHTTLFWSSGQARYVSTMINTMCRDLPRPYGFFTQDDCAVRANGDFHKPLELLYSRFPSRNFSPENTIMIDDLKGNMLDNPENGIIIPKYRPSPNINELQKPDYCLLIIKNWLEAASTSKIKDIRRFPKPEFPAGGKKLPPSLLDKTS